MIFYQKIHEYILVFRKEGELEYPSETIRQEGEWW